MLNTFQTGTEKETETEKPAASEKPEEQKASIPEVIPAEKEQDAPVSLLS